MKCKLCGGTGGSIWKGCERCWGSGTEPEPVEAPVTAAPEPDFACCTSRGIRIQPLPARFVRTS